MSPYELTVRSRFEAAHHLTSYRGSPEPVHGHSFMVEVRVSADELDEEDLAVDFLSIKTCLDRLAGRLHHQHVNTVAPFDAKSPTTENLAKWFFDQVSAELSGVAVASVTVWEGPDCGATYLPE